MVVREKKVAQGLVFVVFRLKVLQKVNTSSMIGGAHLVRSPNSLYRGAKTANTNNM